MMKLKIYWVLCAVICSMGLSACQNKNLEESNLATDVSISEYTTTTQTGNYSEMTNSNMFTTRQIELPTVVDASCAKLMNNFDYKEIIQSEDTEHISLITIDDDDIIIQKNTDLSNNNSMLEYYKYNIPTGTITKLSGNVPHFNVSMATYAFADGNIHAVCESSLNERFHYTVDLKENNVEILKTDTVMRGHENSYEESFFKSYAWDSSSYIEKWYELGEEVVNHIIHYDGNETKEIITRTGVCSYAFSNQKIYELFRDDFRRIRYVNIFDADGNQESIFYLPEVDEIANTIEMLSIWDFKVLGDYLLVNVRDEDMGTEICFLYHLKRKTLDLLLDCRFLQPAQATDCNMKNWYFYSMHLTQTGTNLNLYNLDAEDGITLIAENLSVFDSIITDGNNAAFLKGNQLYFVSDE